MNRKGPSFTVTTSSTSLHLLDQYLHDDVEEEEATEDEDDEDEGEESVVAHEGRLILEVIHDEDERSAEGEELTKVKNVRRHVRRGEEEEFPEREEDEKVREGEGREEGGTLVRMLLRERRSRRPRIAISHTTIEDDEYIKRRW